MPVDPPSRLGAEATAGPAGAGRERGAREECRRSRPAEPSTGPVRSRRGRRVPGRCRPGWRGALPSPRAPESSERERRVRAAPGGRFCRWRRLAHRLGDLRQRCLDRLGQAERPRWYGLRLRGLRLHRRRLRRWGSAGRDQLDGQHRRPRGMSGEDPLLREEDAGDQPQVQQARGADHQGSPARDPARHEMRDSLHGVKRVRGAEPGSRERRSEDSGAATGTVWLDERGGRGAPLVGAREAGDRIGRPWLHREGDDGQDHVALSRPVDRGRAQMRADGSHRARGRLGLIEAVMNGVQSVLEGEDGEEQDERESSRAPRPPPAEPDRRERRRRSRAMGDPAPRGPPRAPSRADQFPSPRLAHVGRRLSGDSVPGSNGAMRAGRHRERPASRARRRVRSSGEPRPPARTWVTR